MGLVQESFLKEEGWVGLEGKWTLACGGGSIPGRGSVSLCVQGAMLERGASGMGLEKEPGTRAHGCP